MSNELAVRTDVVNSLDDVRNVARLLAASNYFEAKGGSDAAIAQLATKVLAGREMGFAPFASVNGIHVIQGKPTVSANLMAAAVKGSGRYDYRVRKMDDAAVSIEFFERVGGRLESIGVSTFTAEDAKKAGTQNMAKFARNMLFARAMSNGVRWYCPDVFSGNAVYTPEELGADVTADGDVIEATYRTETSQSTANGANAPQRPPVSPTEATAQADEQDDPTLATPQMLKALHASGHRLYGDEWDAKRAELVRWATGGLVESSKQLTVEQCKILLDGISEKLRKQAQAQAAAAQAAQPDAH